MSVEKEIITTDKTAHIGGYVEYKIKTQIPKYGTEYKDPIFNIYDKIILKVGGGSLVPITSFGHLLIHGAMHESTINGFMGLKMGLLSLTAAGITSAIIYSFIFALIFKPKN